MTHEEAIYTVADTLVDVLRDIGNTRDTFNHIDRTIERNREAGVKPATDKDIAE
jgi:hypothetical protein